MLMAKSSQLEIKAKERRRQGLVFDEIDHSQKHIFSDTETILKNDSIGSMGPENLLTVHLLWFVLFMSNT